MRVSIAEISRTGGKRGTGEPVELRCADDPATYGNWRSGYNGGRCGGCGCIRLNRIWSSTFRGKVNWCMASNSRSLPLQTQLLHSVTETSTPYPTIRIQEAKTAMALSSPYKCILQH